MVYKKPKEIAELMSCRLRGHHIVQVEGEKYCFSCIIRPIFDMPLDCSTRKGKNKIYYEDTKKKQ